MWFFACVVLCASCQKLLEKQQLFHDMMALREQIAAEFHESHAQVNVIGKGIVVVTFVDSPLIHASFEEKQKRADDVATFVMKNAKRRPSEVRVFFFAQSGGHLDRYTGRPSS